MYIEIIWILQIYDVGMNPLNAKIYIDVHVIDVDVAFGNMLYLTIDNKFKPFVQNVR